MAFCDAFIFKIGNLLDSYRYYDNVATAEHLELNDARLNFYRVLLFYCISKEAAMDSAAPELNLNMHWLCMTARFDLQMFSPLRQEWSTATPTTLGRSEYVAMAEEVKQRMPQ